ncbi:hypothetical protein LTR70_007885 [Exophiala xenobiotica]|uniref:Uncharacterized protein n=1 Tax=Lithohypha guttulata TaxID=1690604 RepID=A0ABR0K4F9_9EURO|nr:hypothetical protein LTR24_007557 [Lithohypha guttulata]KAK5312968.1 hypothetical protein LTR70_007885 [Exophiala xenobiotica]
MKVFPISDRGFLSRWDEMFKLVHRVGAFVAKRKQTKAEALAKKQAAMSKHGWLSPNFGVSPNTTANSSRRSLNAFAAAATGTEVPFKEGIGFSTTKES